MVYAKPVGARINWDDPAARVKRLQEVGRQQYELEHAAAVKASIVEVVNGYQIRRVQNRYGGYMFMVMGLGFGHATLEGARAIAKQAPPRAPAATVH